MTIIRTNANATEYMKAILSKTVTPIDVAKLSTCTGMFVSRTDFVDDSDSVGRLLNIANTSNNFEQEIDDNKPLMIYDDSLGRYTLNISDSTNIQYMSIANGFDYTSEFTMLVVAAVSDITVNNQTLIGTESATTEYRAGISFRLGSSGTSPNIQIRYGTVSTNIKTDIDSGEYYCFIMSFDGDETVYGESLGDDVVSMTKVDDLTTNELNISDPSFYLRDGNVDMVCLFNKNLHDSENETDLETVKTMLSDFYGDVLYGN